MKWSECMPTRDVVIVGKMTFVDDGPSQPPLGIWGPTDPRPTLPIAGWNPGTGTFPPWNPPVQPPLGIWGPGDPRPTLPISGWNPGTGTFPPWPPPTPTPTPPGMGGQLPASDPSGSGWVFGFVPGYGWMWAFVPPKPPVTEPPPTEGGGPEVPEPK